MKNASIDAFRPSSVKGNSNALAALLSCMQCSLLPLVFPEKLAPTDLFTIHLAFVFDPTHLGKLSSSDSSLVDIVFAYNQEGTAAFPGFTTAAALTISPQVTFLMSPSIILASLM